MKSAHFMTKLRAPLGLELVGGVFVGELQFFKKGRGLVIKVKHRF